MTDLPTYSGPRFKLILGKFRIEQVRKMPWGAMQFLIRINQVSLEIDAPHDADVREGDLISLYTEVPLNVAKSITSG